MSGDIGIGKLIKQERHRDAIHIAVAPVEAGIFNVEYGWCCKKMWRIK